MNKYLFLFLILMPIKSLSAQETNRKIHLGFSFSPEITYRIIKIVNDNEYISNKRNITEEDEWGYKIGFPVTYLTSKKTSIETGIYLSNYKYKRYIDFSSPQIPTNSNDKITTKYYYYFLDIPILLRYNYNFNKFSLISCIGIIPQLLIDNKISGDNDNQLPSWWTEVINTNFKKINLSALIKIGLSYQAHPKYAVFIEPNFDIMLLPFKIETVISEYMYFDNSGDLIIEQVEEKIHERLYSYGLAVGFIF